MLRLDVSGRGTYRVPKHNPFVGDARVRDEIWAYGLRAPWRFSFAPDGSCWLDDNGQWQFEEIDIIVKGGNYGWPDRGGFGAFDPASCGKQRRGPAKGTGWRLRGATALEESSPRIAPAAHAGVDSPA